MKIFDLSCGCTGADNAWKKAFDEAGADYTVYEWEQVNSPEKRQLLTEEIEKACETERTLVMYSNHGMDKAFEDYFAAMNGAMLLLPVGTDALLLNHCNLTAAQVGEFNKYVVYGGADNISGAVKYIKKYIFGIEGEEPPKVVETPFNGIYDVEDIRKVYNSLEEFLESQSKQYDTYVAILSHRHSWMNDTLQAEKGIAKALAERGIGVVAVFSSGEKSEIVQSYGFEEIASHYFSLDGKVFISALINFQMHLIKAENGLSIAENSVRLFSEPDVPVFHPISSYMLTKKSWEEQDNPLAGELQSAYLNPEMAGMIEPVLVAVRDEKTKEIIPFDESIDYFAQRVKSWCRLRKKKNSDKRIAVILHNSVCSGVEATVGKGFGLDVFESVARLLKRLDVTGYKVTDIPENGEELRKLIMNKKAFSDFRWTSVEDIYESGGCLYRMSRQEYMGYFSELYPEMQESMISSWGEAPGEGMVIGDDLIISGISFGNVVVMVQPKRGCYGAKCTGEVCRILHDPACPPAHQYIATYRYISRIFAADAIIHFGTDGSLEYLPGKGNGLDKHSWTYALLDNLPNIYPYHLGVISEGTIAKRRANAVTVGYYPVSSFGVDKKGADLLGKINEYTEACELDNGQAESLRSEIEELISKSKAYKSLLASADSFSEGVQLVRTALLKCADGGKLSRRHIFGENPDFEECVSFICEVLYAYNTPARKEGESDGEYRIRLREYVTGCLSGDKKNNYISENIHEIYNDLNKTTNEIDNLIHLLDGGYIGTCEGGMPDENGRKIIPAGRNFYMMNMDKIPSETAYERGKLLAEQLISAYVRDEGRLPHKIAMNMISLDIARTHGEQLSQFMYLMGVKPIWDKYGRVTGLAAIPLSELGRPRIDITLRISGVMRDTWPDAVNLLDDTVLLVSALDERDEENYIRESIHEAEFEYGDLSERAKTIRIFGDPPGAFGAGIDLALKAGAWESDKDLARYFIQSSAFAYGNGLNGRRSVREFIENSKKVELTCDTTSSRRMDTLACGFGLQVQGGFKLIAETIGKRTVRQYQSENEKNSAVKTQTLAESVQEDIDNTLLNAVWQEDVMKREYDGASEMMHRIQNMFDAKCTSGCVADETVDRIAEEYINNPEMRKWLLENNRFAAEEIARRLLELESRGKWKPDENILESLRGNYLQIEGDMEEELGGIGEIQGGSVEIVRDDKVEIWKNNLKDIDECLKKFE